MKTLELVAYNVGSELLLEDYIKDKEHRYEKIRWTQPLIQKFDSGILFAYNFGTLVFINISKDAVIKKIKEFKKYIRNPLKKPLKEECLIEINPNVKTYRIEFGKIILPKEDQRAMKIITFAISQSVTLDYFETIVDKILDSLGELMFGFPAKFRLKTKKILKTLAESMEIRHSVISDLSILDKPAITWESPKLEELYDMLYTEYELGERFSKLEHKLQIILENCQTVFDVMSTRELVILEILIVLLFVIDLVIITLEYLI